jgi:hypothetical protein
VNQKQKLIAEIAGRIMAAQNIRAVNKHDITEAVEVAKWIVEEAKK